MRLFNSIRLAYFEEFENDPEIQKAMDFLCTIDIKIDRNELFIVYPQMITESQMYGFYQMIANNRKWVFYPTGYDDHTWFLNKRSDGRKLQDSDLLEGFHDTVNCFSYFFFNKEKLKHNETKIVVTKSELEIFDSEYPK